MSARAILSVVAAIFLVLAIVRIGRNGGRIDPAARTWLLIAIIFGAVSGWLWFGAPAG